jgi:hypothetical protein
MKIVQKNMRNINIPSIHMFASCIMSRRDSYACSPNIYAEPIFLHPAPLALTCRVELHLSVSLSSFSSV